MNKMMTGPDVVVQKEFRDQAQFRAAVCRSCNKYDVDASYVARCSKSGAAIADNKWFGRCPERKW